MNKFLPSLLTALVFLFFFVPNVYGQVVINEFQLSPSSDQWIELFNKGATEVEISGWVIDDKEGGSSKSFTIPAGTILQPSKCISYESGNFDWNTANADEVRLISPTSIEVYLYSSSPGNNVSIGRVVDGEGELVILSSQSRDALNSGAGSCLAPTPSPSPSPTESPTPTPTETPTPAPTPSRTPTPKPVKTPSLVLGSETGAGSTSADVLALRNTPNSLTTSTPVSGSSEKQNFPVFAVGLIGTGIIFMGVAGFLAYKKSRMDLPKTLD